MFSIKMNSKVNEMIFKRSIIIKHEDFEEEGRQGVW